MPEQTSAIRYDWTTAEILDILQQPLLDLVYQAQTVHRQHNPNNAIQLATLLSVKTGGCAENCAYCPSRRTMKLAFSRSPQCPWQKC